MVHVATPQTICRFGIATADITPPVGIYHRMWGAATHDQAQGIHRPLSAAVAVFESVPPKSGADGRQIVINLDHCLMGHEEMDQFLANVCPRAKVDRNSVLVLFTHTHAAGLLSLDRVNLPGGDLLPGYLRLVEDRVVEALGKAQSRTEEATIVYGEARCDLAGHRDFYDEQTKQFVCGFNPGQPGDETVVVGRVTNLQGKILATLVNYACHPTTLAWENQLISPDYPGAMREVIERETEAPCVFFQGASGELGPREGYVGDTAVADRNGKQLGFAALSKLVALPPPRTRFEYAGPVVSGATLGTWKHRPLSADEQTPLAAWKIQRREIPMMYRPGLPTIEQANREREEWQAKEKAAEESGDVIQVRDCHAMVERKTRMIARLKALPKGEKYPYRCIVWRMGDAIWVAVPGEPYNLLQRALRERFPQQALIVTPLAFGWGPSYLPIAEVYDRGIYQESVALVSPGSLEMLVDELSRDIEKLIS